MTIHPVNVIYFDPAATPHKNTGVIVRKLMRNGKEYFPAFARVEMETGSEYHRIFLNSKDDKDIIKEIRDLYNSNPTCYEYFPSPDEISAKILTGTVCRSFDDNLIDDIPHGKHIAFVELKFKKYETPKSGSSLKVYFNEICLITTSTKQKELVNVKGLPELHEFENMNIKERLKYYEPGRICNKEHNRRLNYCLVREDDDLYHCHKSSVPDGATISLSRYKSKARVDYVDRKLYHYAMVLHYCDEKASFSKLKQEDIDKKLMSAVWDYLTRRKIDTRGIWYDRGHAERAHINLHLASHLPPQYFKALFDNWFVHYGGSWTRVMYSPAAWRLYASRNHHMYGTEEHDYKKFDTYNGKFQEGSKRFHKFEEYVLSQGLSVRREISDYDRNALVRVLNYELYPNQEEDELVSMIDIMKF